MLLGRRCERNDSNKRPHKMLILKINGSIFIRAFIVNSSRFMLEVYLRDVRKCFVLVVNHEASSSFRNVQNFVVNSVV